ncbi:MAG: hypothetical protein JNK46_10450 [Methylobacteriaceae bacterium]|nr:hypothetical protein [Methylobacteriaceae bacterium]
MFAGIGASATLSGVSSTAGQRFAADLLRSSPAGNRNFLPMKFALATVAAFGVGLAGAGGYAHLSTPRAASAGGFVSTASPAAPSALAFTAGAATAGMAAAAAALGVAGPKSSAPPLPANPAAAFADVRSKLTAPVQLPAMSRAKVPMTTLRVSPSGGFYRR